MHWRRGRYRQELTEGGNRVDLLAHYGTTRREVDLVDPTGDVVSNGGQEGHRVNRVDLLAHCGTS